VLTWPERGRRSTGRVRATALIAVLLGLGVLTSCASSQDADVYEVARRFYAAVQEGDGPRACQMLSPTARAELEQSSGEACSTAIVGEDITVGSDVGAAEVYGTMAIVHTDEDTMFLSRFPAGWQVTGVGCRPTQQLDQFDCSVSGG